jgi:hypothetical protein
MNAIERIRGFSPDVVTICPFWSAPLAIFVAGSGFSWVFCAAAAETCYQGMLSLGVALAAMNCRRRKPARVWRRCS